MQPRKQGQPHRGWKGAAKQRHGDTVDKAMAWDAIAEKNAEIDRLKGLLADKQYIQTLADYNKGHLSHAGWLAAKEKRT